MQQSLEMETEERKVYRTREVNLSQAEAADKGIEVGRLAGEIEQHKKAGKEAESRQDALIEELKNNKTNKERECVLKLFYTTRTAQVWDGDELIEERAMSDSEFQRDLPLQHGSVENQDDVLDVEYLETDEEKRQDVADVISSERSKNKPSIVDMR